MLLCVRAINSAADSSGMAMSPMTMQTPAQPQDYNKLFKAEKDNLELAEGLYKWAGNDVEIRILKKYGKL